MPVAPYSIINMLAGASQLKLGDFLLGTMLGMSPGILAVAGLLDRGLALVADPNIGSLAVFVGLVLVIAGGFWWLRRWFVRHSKIIDDADG